MKFTASENTGIEPKTVENSELKTSVVDTDPSLFCTDTDTPISKKKK
jgi:hypothetical protein